jgi:ketosteroid isomerase-like protein
MREAGEDDALEQGVQPVRAYYEAIDAKNYDRLADLLAPGVVHERPDRTIEGRETLVGFMRDDRPNKDTSHEVEAVYRRTGDDRGDYAVRGRLLDADGNPMFAFVDAFDVEQASENEDGRIARIRTYTH